MKIRLLFLFICLTITVVGFSQTSRLTNFNDLMQSLNSGEKVRVVIDYSQCKWASGKDVDKPLPKAVFGMEISVYEYFAAGAVRNTIPFVVFSESKLIQNPRGKGFVLNYGKVRINEDNTVQITAKYIHPKKYTVLMDLVFTGKLNDGINNEGISLFK